MYDFAYAKPASLAEAVTLLATPDAKALAGGQTFIPVLKQRLNRPPVVVDLAALGLDFIRQDGAHLVIGGMARHAAVAASAEVQSAIPALARLAGWIGDRQVRNRGTIGGSLANNDPSACYPAAALALGATIVTDRREIAADDYFQGMFTTALEPDELITAVRFPIPVRANYEKFRNPASRYAMVGVFVAEGVAGGPARVRVAITGAGQGGVFRHAQMEAALARDFSSAALDGIDTPPEGLIGDIHGSAAYRAHLIGVTARRAVAGATSPGAVAGAQSPRAAAGA
jgi:carbon-monoxide dehydrogenase medium subunit